MASLIHLWSPGFGEFGGGIGAFSRECATALQAEGYNVSLFGKSDVSGSWSGLPLYGAASSPPRLRTARFAAGVLTACLRERPQQVITCHVNFAPVAHIARKTARIPFTVIAHGIDVQLHLDRRKKEALLDAARILAVSEWTRQLVIAETGVDPSHVLRLPNTVDEERFTIGPKPESLLRRYRLAPGEHVLLTVGRLDERERYKGYDRIVAALPAIMKECGQVRYIVAGSGGDHARIMRLAADAGVDASVTIAGFVPDDELADHYRLADVFAMPSTGEGFGIVFLEAMACGIPVLAGNRDGSVDALDEGRLGRLVDPLDVGAIAAGIIDLLAGRGPRMWFNKQALRDA
ncbi:MAG TPA: glycosyltransferase family 4 protein, partial [Gemmatimonadaceae bacterium]|nr:glycosyltransferase family 4 protein [Gemmatimonadaceae bacterium]